MKCPSCDVIFAQWAAAHPMLTEGQSTANSSANKAPRYVFYPFFLIHMLVFGVSGFKLAYEFSPSISFMYLHGGLAILLYTFFYIVIFGIDEVKWMFINAGLGLLGIYTQIGWILVFFGKDIDSYPLYIHVTPFLYFVLYTFLIRQLILDITGAREDEERQKKVNHLYVVGSVLVYLVGYAIHPAPMRHGDTPMMDTTDLREATVPPTYTFDLESGRVGGFQGTSDLFWQATTRSERCLRPSVDGKAWIAPLADQEFDIVDPARLATLVYSSRCIIHTNSGGELKKGLAFAVRTVEGNFAKVRVVGIGAHNELALEWRVFESLATALHQKGVTGARPPHGQSASAPDNPSLAWRTMLDSARGAYRERRYDDAVLACERAIDTARTAGAVLHAAALTGCGSMGALHYQAPLKVEAWLLQAAYVAEPLSQAEIVSTLGLDEALLKERGRRMLGLFYRDHKRPREAAQEFALAIDAVRALGPPETGIHRMALRSDMFDLGVALARLGDNENARQAFAESRKYYIETEPQHPYLKVIADEEQRLGIMAVK